MNNTTKENKFDESLKNLRNYHPNSEWRFVRQFYLDQMLPIIKFLKDNDGETIQPNDLYKIAFEKYLIISCVSLIEFFMKRKIRKAVDTQNLDPSIFNLSKVYTKMKRQNPTITKGECVAINLGFTNAININDNATIILNSDPKFKALNLDFMTAIKKIDRFDPLKYIKGLRVRAISYNFNNFKLMFKMRKEIVHEMKYQKISLNKLGGFCDNTMNFLDAADFIFKISSRDDVVARLKSNKTLKQLHYILPT